MTDSALVRRSTHLIEVVGLQDVEDGSYPTDATVLATLYDPSGNPVAAATGLTLTLVEGASGAATTYRGSIPKTVDLSPSGNFTLRATATDVDGNAREFNLVRPATNG